MVESDDDLSTRFDNPNNYVQPVDDYGKVIKIGGMILDVMGVVWIPSKEVGFGRDGPHSCIFTNCGVFRLNCELVPGTWVRCIVMESKKLAVCAKPVIAPVHTRFVECNSEMKLVLFSRVEKDSLKPYTYNCDYLGPITDDSATSVAPRFLWAEYEFGSDNMLHISKFHPTVRAETLINSAFLPTSRSCYQEGDGTINSPVAVKWAEEFLKECQINTDVFGELTKYVFIRPTPRNPPATLSHPSPVKETPTPAINPTSSKAPPQTAANEAISDKVAPATKASVPEGPHFSSSPEDFDDATTDIFEYRSKGRYQQPHQRQQDGNIFQQRGRGRYRSRGN